MDTSVNYMNIRPGLPTVTLRRRKFTTPPINEGLPELLSCQMNSGVQK